MNLADPKEMFRLDGRVAIVTGGGRGLGEVFVKAYAGAGAAVVVADFITENAKKVAADVRDAGGKAIGVHVDVRQTGSVETMVSRAVGEFGKLDVLMNNAGIVVSAKGEEMTDEEWDNVVAVDLTGVFKCCRAAARHMIPRKSGSIVNIASMSGVISNHPQPQCSYNAAKAGVIMLTKSLAGEWAPHGVRVNAISPGYMETEMTLKARSVADWFKVWLETTPMGRLGKPGELAGLAIYLASDASSFMTGSNVLIDGGYTVW